MTTETTTEKPMMTTYELWEYKGCPTFILAVEHWPDGRRVERFIGRLESERSYDTAALARVMVQAANREHGCS